MKRHLSRVSLTQAADASWCARVIYLDDNTEDRQSGFGCRADAHGWVETRLERHFRMGVPGRLGGVMAAPLSTITAEECEEFGCHDVSGDPA